MAQVSLSERAIGRPEGQRRQVVTNASQVELVFRYWWVVLAVTLLALVAGYISASSVATTYTGRASLIVNSNNRSPDQDAVLVQGYVEYFNDGAYQGQLVRQAGVKEAVTLSARAAASSPILLVESTASTPGDAQSSASAVAEVFKNDINKVILAGQKTQITNLQAQITALSKSAAANSGSIAALQSQIDTVQADRTNQLQELQLQGGVSANAPKLKTNLIFGLFGGIIMGSLAALAIGRIVEFLRRRRTLRAS